MKFYAALRVNRLIAEVVCIQRLSARLWQEYERDVMFDGQKLKSYVESTEHNEYMLLKTIYFMQLTI